MKNIYKKVKRVWNKVNSREGLPKTEGVRLEASFEPIGIALGVIIGIVGLILIGLVLFTGDSIKGNIEEAKAGIKASKEVERLPAKVKCFNNKRAVKIFRAIGWLGFAYTIWFYDNETTIIYVVLGLITLASIIYSIVIDAYEMWTTGRFIREGKWIHRNSPIRDESRSIEERTKQNDELKEVQRETSNDDYVKKDSGLK